MAGAENQAGVQFDWPDVNVLLGKDFLQDRSLQ